MQISSEARLHLLTITERISLGVLGSRHRFSVLYCTFTIFEGKKYRRPDGILGTCITESLFHEGGPKTFGNRGSSRQLIGEVEVPLDFSSFWVSSKDLEGD